MELTKKRIISLYVSIGSYGLFLERIINLARSNRSSYVCVANVHMLVEADNDAQFASVVNNADIVTPDGMPLCVAYKYFYKKAQDRIAGMDLLPDLIRIASKKSLRVYFYGGSQELLDAVNSYLAIRYPRLIIAGMYSPPFRSLEKDEEDAVVQLINDSTPNIVFVSLGCPKQEKWMASMKGRIKCCMIGVGGAIPVMARLKKRAPLWMQHCNLEWFYRFTQEPRRLFKRYLVTNTKFCGLFVKELGKMNIK